MAVGASGTVYVAELFAGQISKVSGGHGVPYVSVPGVVSIAAGGGSLYAATLGDSGPGQIVRIDP